MSPDSIYSSSASPSFAFDLSDNEDDVEVHAGEDADVDRQWTSFWPRSNSIDTSVDATSPNVMSKTSTPDDKTIKAEISRPPSVVRVAHRIPSLESGFRRGSDSSLLAAVLDKGRRRSSGRSAVPSVLDRRRSSVLSKLSVSTDDSEHLRKFQAMNAAVGRRFSEVIQVEVAPTSPTLSASSSSDSDVEERDWAPEVPQVTKAKLNIWSPDTPNSGVTEDPSEVGSLSPQETPIAPVQPVVETLSNFPLNSTVAVAATGYAFPGASSELRMDRYVNTPSPPMDPGAFLRRAQRPALDRAKSEQLIATSSMAAAAAASETRKLHHRSISASSTLFAAGTESIPSKPKKAAVVAKPAATTTADGVIRKPSLNQDVAEFSFLASEIILQPDAAMPPFPVKPKSAPATASSAAPQRPAIRRPISMQEMITVVQNIERESSNQRSRPRSGAPAIASADQIQWNEDWAKGKQAAAVSTPPPPSSSSETSPATTAAVSKSSRKPVPELDTPRSDVTYTPHAHQYSPESHGTSPRERDSRQHHQSQHPQQRRRRCRRCEEKRALRILAEAARITADMRLSPRALYEDEYFRHHQSQSQHTHEWSSSSHHHRARSNDLPPPPSSMPRHHHHHHQQRPGHERSLTEVTPSHAAYFSAMMPPPPTQWNQWSPPPAHVHTSAAGPSSRRHESSAPLRNSDISRPTLIHTTSHRDDLVPLSYSHMQPSSHRAVSSRPGLQRSATDIPTEPVGRHQLRHKTSAALSRFIHGFGNGSTSPKSGSSGSGSEHHHREVYHS